ncbi:Kunitz family trypsin and protease inhibitor protein [Raphanus sativus]|nr:Kunitz family trypsin and protease inhibitor protein [Raphanus sativus]
MKTSFLVTFLLAAAVCTHALEEVKDSNGNPVRVGAQYFIQRLRPRVTTGSFGYHPNILGRDTIDTSADINIEFRSPIWPVCTEFSKLWAVDSSSASKEPAVIIGGEPKSPNSAFKIEKAAGAHTYKLTTSSGTVGTTPGAWLSAPQLLVTK